MDEATARTDIRVREAEKVHSIRFFPQGRGAKKKDPNCIQIRVLLWKITAILIQIPSLYLLGSAKSKNIILFHYFNSI